MEAIILPNSMFDDGSLECRTFCIATHDDAWITSWNTIKREYPDHIERIKAQDASGGLHYIGIGSLGDPGYTEIQWD
jgi:hypothetical protein